MQYRRTILLGVVMLLGAGIGQAIRGQAVQVSGELEVRYDDVLTELYVQGVNVIGDTLQVNPGWHVRVPFNVPVTDSVLVIAATVRNGGYTGGLMVNINTPMGQAVTNSKWKWMLRPSTGWEQPGYDDSQWYPVKDQGAADETPTMVRDSSCINRTDSCPMNVFIASGARFIWAAEDLYFRRTFTVDTACSATVWAGSRGPHTIYLDGAEVVHVDSAEYSVPGQIYLSAGSHVLAVFAQTTIPLSQGTGGALKVAVAKSIKVPRPIIEWDSLFNPDTVGWDTVIQLRPVLVCDTNWRVSCVESPNWMQPSFDDGAWWNAVLINDQIYPRGYPGLTEFPAGFRTMWLPQTISFRGSIHLSQLPIRSASRGQVPPQRVAIGFTAGRLAVMAPWKGPFRVDVYGPGGRRVAGGLSARTGLWEVRTDTWARGTYLVRITQGGSELTRRVSVTR